MSTLPQRQDLKKINDYLWEIPRSFRGDMKVPARIYASEKILEGIFRDRSLEQLLNVAALPGIVDWAIVMPDAHEGYGFPIGGVAAMKMPDGLISPGGVGYDINCLHPNTTVNIGFGSSLEIKDLEKHWPGVGIPILNKKNLILKQSRVTHFFKRREKGKIFSIKTNSGFCVRTTGDHPIYTPAGMREAASLKTGQRVVVFPFRGVDYRVFSGRGWLINLFKIKRALRELGLSSAGNRHQQIIHWLSQNGFDKLDYNSEKLPYLLKISGYLLGDGTVNFIGKRRKGTAWFYGTIEDLKNIKKDLTAIGIRSSLYKRTRNHRIKTFYKNYRFSVVENGLRVSSSAFVVLLYVLGMPLGNKTAKEFFIPAWIKKAPLWQKRLFLAAFFGAELSRPATMNKYNFYNPTLNINKNTGLKNNGIKFLNDLKLMLEEFSIRSSKISEMEELSGNGKTIGLRFQIYGDLENLLKLFGNVGFEYAKTKQTLACWAVAYLRYKKNILDMRQKVRKLARRSYRSGVPADILRKRYSHAYCNDRFIEHSIWSLDRETPRIAFNFPSFKEFIKKNRYGKDGFVVDEISEIKTNYYDGFVYDLTVGNKDHNFIAENIVVSNCGIRLLRSDLSYPQIKNNIGRLVSQIQRDVPSGVGRGGREIFRGPDMDKILTGGARCAVELGFGESDDLKHCESGGFLTGSDPVNVSGKAKARGADQVGTIGAGNHFIEIQKVETIFDTEAARALGLKNDQIAVMIHTGSRGLGHQIATEYIQLMMRMMLKYKIELPDRELAAAPFNSSEGQDYFSAMKCGANFAWANRQMIAHLVRGSFKKVLGETAKLNTVYDVAHNIAKQEKHNGRELLVHRKGATRAFGPHHPEIPAAYQDIGQPVIIPGSMGTASYVLLGTEQSMKEAFGSACHGAGRTMSRHAALRLVRGENLKQELESRGIEVRGGSWRGLAEEAPIAYKDIDAVVETVVGAGIARKAARLTPVGVVKG